MYVQKNAAENNYTHVMLSARRYFSGWAMTSWTKHASFLQARTTANQSAQVDASEGVGV
jgi:hypothetical protein